MKDNFMLHVNINNDFWLSITEVNLFQWQKIMGITELHPDKPNPFSNDNPGYPVVSKYFDNVSKFLERLEKI